MKKTAILAVLGLSACRAAPDPLASPDPREQQKAAVEALLEGRERGRAARILATSARCELWEDELRELRWRRPGLASALAWHWLRDPSIEAFTADRLAWGVLNQGRRELVRILRRVDPEGLRTSLSHAAAVSAAPEPADRDFLLARLADQNQGYYGPAAGLVRLGDERGLIPLLEDAAGYPEGYEADLDILPDEERVRRIAGRVHALIGTRFTDARLAQALRSVHPEIRSDVLASLAGRIGAREELFRMARHGVGEAIRALADHPGDDTVDVLRAALALKDEVSAAALASLATLGDPRMQAWIAAALAKPGSLAEAFALEWTALTRPIRREAVPLAEEEGADPVPVYADWQGLTAAVIDVPSDAVVTDPAVWNAFWARVRRPAPAVDFDRQAGLVLLYVDPRPEVISPFDIRILGLRAEEGGRVLRVQRRNSSFGLTAVDHAGTAWRVLVVPRAWIPRRIETEEKTVSDRGRSSRPASAAC